MTVKQEVQKRELAAFLRGLALTGCVVIGMANPVMEVATNIRSGLSLAAAVEQRYEWIGEGPYVVEYKPKDEDDADDPDPIIRNHAVAFTVLFKLTNGPITGGYPQLVQALSEFEYMIEIAEDTFGYIGHMLIAMPESPPELEKLQQVLEQYSLFYALPDATGELHTGNMHNGRGIDAFLRK
jgi:hypothetical protein